MDVYKIKAAAHVSDAAAASESIVKINLTAAKDASGIPLAAVPAHEVVTVKQMDLESLPMTTHQLGSVISKNAAADRRADDVFTVVAIDTTVAQGQIAK